MWSRYRYRDRESVCVCGRETCMTILLIIHLTPQPLLLVCVSASVCRPCWSALSLALTSVSFKQLQCVVSLLPTVAGQPTMWLNQSVINSIDCEWCRPLNNRWLRNWKVRKTRSLLNKKDGYRQLNVRQFLQRLILASPGYAPGTIAVNVTWMERGFNAGQTHSSIYPSIFNRLRAIARWSEIATFSYPLHLTPPFGCSHWNSGEKFGPQKTRIMGLSGAEDSLTIGWAVSTQYQRVTDRQTDGRTDRRPAYSYNVLSMTDAR